MIRAMRRGRYLGIGSGTARRSMVLAPDVAEILSEIGGKPGIFHLCDGYHPSFLELEAALAQSLKLRRPRRLPRPVARGGAYVGDFLQRLSGRRLPLNSRSYLKMTSTLTFSDERARRELNWHPSRVLDRLAEVVLAG
jgi:nucleoside-diphosphate-sugar epimerase